MCPRRRHRNLDDGLTGVNQRKGVESSVWNWEWNENVSNWETQLAVRSGTESVAVLSESWWNYHNKPIAMDFPGPYTPTSGVSRVEPSVTAIMSYSPAHTAMSLHIRTPSGR